MGKSKHKRRNKDRTNVTAKPPSDPELAAIREQRILPVLKDLQSPELKTRSTAAGVITNIIEDAKFRKLLLREQLVTILLEQTLTDSQLEARTAGWGILRNLALEEAADFCIHLYRQDILTAISGAIRSITLTVGSIDVPFAKLPQAQQKFTWDLISSIVSLLSSLSDAADEIIEVISRTSMIIEFFFGLLSFNSTPQDVQYEVLSCLISLTEDNKPLTHQITNNQVWLKILQKCVDAPSLTLDAIAACGVLHNVFSTMQWFDHNTPIEGASDATLIPLLVQSIDVATADSPKINGDGSKAPHIEQALQLALEVIASIATDLQEALEHGSKYEEEFEGFNDKPETDGGDEKMEDTEDDGAEEDEHGDMGQEEMDADMNLVTGDGSDGDESPKEELTLDRLVRVAAPKVLALAKETARTSNKAIQNHALSALNNVAWTISTLDFSQSHLDALQEFWSTFAQQIWNDVISPVLASNTADIGLASNITSLAWAVSRSVKGALIIQPEEHRKFMALYNASKALDSPPEQENSNGNEKQPGKSTDAFQGLGLKAIGVLGSLALDPAPVELNREIGVFLITVLESLPDSPAPDAVEALNQIFDIYADRSYAVDEAVFWKDGFHKHLEEILPKMKKMAKSIDKRTNVELRSRADEAVLNLGRFLKYKKMEREKKLKI